MVKITRDFQVFVKPAGGRCNLACDYCYYVERSAAGPDGPARMPEELLTAYIVQHLAAATGPEIRFSWHGGEPTLLGLDYFRRIVELQRRHCPSGVSIRNGLQTNGTLLDDPWARFLAAEGFAVGVSLDGPAEMHDRFRRTRHGRSSFDRALQGYRRLRQQGVPADVLCVVNAHNVRQPLAVYRFFKEIGAPYVSFLPLVERQSDGSVGERSVPPAAWGDFLCAVFDEWVREDIGRIKIQIIEEATRTAFGQEHSLCIFRPVCGDIPVVEHNGDFYSCDHFVDEAHRLGNIRDMTLAELLDSPAQRAFGQAKQATLPRICRECPVLEMCHGECPKNRFVPSPDGDFPLNYLCAGYRQFFTHCRPFVNAVAVQWRQSLAPDPSPAKPGRNAPCPCGSGRKYKHCCGR
ncbi:MAG: anaerobic sulfatase maturase [Acidobacteria bacterium]|nr:anaerobic sulfatase maturase [Acidobacteriota bacterium]